MEGVSGGIVVAANQWEVIVWLFYGEDEVRDNDMNWDISAEYTADVTYFGWINKRIMGQG